jgi:hypothetical protein
MKENLPFTVGFLVCYLIEFSQKGKDIIHDVLYDNRNVIEHPTLYFLNIYIIKIQYVLHYY